MEARVGKKNQAAVSEAADFEGYYYFSPQKTKVRRPANCSNTDMRYRVNFRRRFDSHGEPEENLIESLRLPKGLVLKAIILEPETLNDPLSEESLSDDDFLKAGT